MKFHFVLSFSLLFCYWSLCFFCFYHLDVFRRFPRDFMNASHRPLNPAYWFRNTCGLWFNWLTAFFSCFRQNFSLPTPFIGHGLLFKESALWFFNICLSISANVSSTKLIFGLYAAWIGPSGNSHPHLNLSTRAGLWPWCVRNVLCGFLHGSPMYCVQFPSPKHLLSSALGWPALHALSCMKHLNGASLLLISCRICGRSSVYRATVMLFRYMSYSSALSLSDRQSPCHAYSQGPAPGPPRWRVEKDHVWE